VAAQPSKQAPSENVEVDPRLDRQLAVELILGRQLASYLGVPIFIVDPRGDMVYYNEPAEAILGIRFEETGRMAMEEWSRDFTPTDADGTPIEPENLPLVIALQESRPACDEFFIQGLDEATRHIQVIGIPVIGLAGKKLGAIAILWEVE
jgi:PAS domain-containing protein